MMYPYHAWAKAVAGAILQCDVDCGMKAADSTPEPEKARAALVKLAQKLQRDGERVMGKLPRPNATQPPAVHGDGQAQGGGA
jgi:hypothetical protein